MRRTAVEAPPGARRRDLVTLPVLAGILALGVVAALGTDDGAPAPAPAPVVASAAGDDADLTGIREAVPPELEGSRSPELADELGARVPATTGGDIEPFSYTSRADGRITIRGDWVERNIAPVQLPGMAETSCHRVVIPQLLAAVDELAQRGLYDHLDPAQFAGCFVARHVDREPSRPLSMHAWGLAIDFNTRDNPLGATPVMDPRVVEVFEGWGFDWGGHWSRPDGMHFELARIVPTG